MSAALTKPDADAAARMLADTFYAVNPDGSTQGKDQFLADLKSGKFKLESNQLDDMKVHAAGADLAIVTYRSTDKGSYEGHDLSGQYRWLDVFAKRGGTWQFVVSQGTKIEQPKKP
jgi:ketosteroid isomerase-like protein